MALASTHVLITGGQGFLGSYIMKDLLRRKARISLFDMRKDDHILQQVLSREQIHALDRSFGDVSNFNEISKLIAQKRPSHIIHLAALQIPTCKQDPVHGSLVNVVGTINVFESVRRAYDKNYPPIVYASSAAVAGNSADYATEINDDTPHKPRTHYGVFKLANEGNARIFWQDNKIRSIGLRPLTIYGVGREIGMTSGPTKAIKASILNKPYTIQFSGKTSFLFVEDAADIFINCVLSTFEGAHALNMRGNILSVEDFLKILNEELPQSRNLINIKESATSLPLAYNFNEEGLHKLLNGKVQSTSIREGIRKTAKQFMELQKQGLLSDKDLLD